MHEAMSSALRQLLGKLQVVVISFCLFLLHLVLSIYSNLITTNDHHKKILTYTKTQTPSLRTFLSSTVWSHANKFPATTITMSATESKQEKIDRVQANLPLPEDPPTASDWNSADASINVSKNDGDKLPDINSASNNPLNDQGNGKPSGVRVADGEYLSKVGRERIEKGQ